MLNGAAALSPTLSLQSNSYTTSTKVIKLCFALVLGEFQFYVTNWILAKYVGIELLSSSARVYMVRFQAAVAIQMIPLTFPRVQHNPCVGFWPCRPYRAV